VAEGQVRVNGDRVVKPAAAVGPGDVLTFAQGGRVRVVRILGLANRRGPAPEAQALYEDLTPPDAPETPRAGPRPTKRDRRALDALRDGEDDAQ
jgi:ribosome-associated heat shock protein Hsp15